MILGLAMEYSDSEIAAGLHISVPTLRKYYFSELKAREMQRTRFDLWRSHQLAKLANDGNVTAIKELGKVVDKRDRQLAEERIRAAQDTAPLPKKVARRQAAQEAASGGDDDWGDELVSGSRPH